MDLTVPGGSVRRVAVSKGVGVRVHGLRMQSFRPDRLPLDAGHVRTTAVAVAAFLRSASQRQARKQTGRSLKLPPPAAMGRLLVLLASIVESET